MRLAVDLAKGITRASPENQRRGFSHSAPSSREAPWGKKNGPTQNATNNQTDAIPSGGPDGGRSAAVVRRTGFVLVAAALFAFAFAPLIRAPFLFDDLSVIQKDPSIANVRIGAADSVDLFSGLSILPRPVRQFTHRLDAALAGPDDAWFPHLANLTFHLGVGVLFFFLLRRVSVASSVAAAASLLFLLHPVCVESVGVVSHRKELLSALFLLLALHALLARGPFVPWLSVPALFLAVFAKETAVIAPFLFLVAVFERSRANGGTALVRRGERIRVLGFAVAAVLFAGLAYAQIRHGMSAVGAAPELDPDRSGHFLAGAPWSLALSASVRAFPRYLHALLWPARLTIDPVFGLTVPALSPRTLAAALVCLLYLGAVVVLYRRRSAFLAPLIWIPTALSPCLLPPLLRGGHIAAVADRYAYLASLGFAWTLALALARIARTLRPAALRLLPLLAVLCLFAAFDRAQASEYRSLESFWARAVRLNPASAPARLNHALALWRECGDRTAARREFERMAETAPDFPAGVCGHADLLLAEGEGAHALALVDAALARANGTAAPAALLRKRAALLLALARFSDALAAFRTAEAAGVDAPAFQRGFAEACKRTLLWPEAVLRYRRAAVDPRFREAFERHRLLVEDPPLARNAPLDVLVLGDSVPHGTGAGPGGADGASLAKRLAAGRPGLRTEDRTVPGLTAFDLNRDFPSLLPSTNAPARFCLLMAGHNDAFGGRDERGILFELSGCIFKARQCGMRPVVIGPIRVTSVPERDRTTQEQTLDRLDALLSAFCADARVPFLSPRRTVLAEPPPPGGWLDPATGNHLTDAGMDRLAFLCLSALAPSIPKGTKTP